MTITLLRLQLLAWLAASVLADKLWAATRHLAHWTGRHSSRAEMKLAIASENAWNAEVSDPKGSLH
jgi:hypothetical protein